MSTLTLFSQVDVDAVVETPKTVVAHGDVFFVFTGEDAAIAPTTPDGAAKFAVSGFADGT